MYHPIKVVTEFHKKCLRLFLDDVPLLETADFVDNLDTYAETITEGGEAYDLEKYIATLQAGLDHAAGEVERLRAALDDALAKEEESQVQSGEYAGEVLELRAENTTLEIERDEARAENDRLRAALEPFAKVADDWDRLIASPVNLSAEDVVPLTMGPYQAARQALEER